ncbi:MAG: molybdenum cofactor biosynthesis protein B [Oceanospirillaceae bacterium]|nr:molybdenum cofactor biosynthesis protein B [Oceanospirillaceae bacterium]
MTKQIKNITFRAINIAVLTVSDTRTKQTDSSGDVLQKSVEDAGHQVAARAIVIDDIYKIRACVSQWIADSEVHAILITGGTGFTARDSTPEAMLPLFDKEIDGYGELFRALSYQEIGTSTIQSRAVAGVANKTVIFCMPGSPNACRTAWEKIICQQLDSTHRPCNFVEMVMPVADSTCETRA